MNKRIAARGFTLIELLVVLAIIGILAAVLYANFNDARDDARNKAVQTDLGQMQLAIELYKAQNGQYPAAGTLGGSCAGNAAGADYALRSTSCSGEYVAGLEPDFIADLQRHNTSGNTACTVEYAVDEAEQAWYKLTAINCFAGAANASEGIGPGEEYSRCPSSCGTCDGVTMGSAYTDTAAFYESMAVYSLGGECY